MHEKSEQSSRRKERGIFRDECSQDMIHIQHKDRDKARLVTCIFPLDTVESVFTVHRLARNRQAAKYVCTGRATAAVIM